MGGIIALIPVILQAMQNPTVQQLMPLLTQLLAQLGSANFPGVDPNKAQSAGASLFDLNSVKWTQTALNLLGKNLTVDGSYGDATKAAVKEFQQANNLVADGWAGQLTQEALRGAIIALPHK